MFAPSEESAAALLWSFGFWGYELTRPRRKVELSSTGVRTWWLDLRLHREDGPAVEWPNGNRQWWREGKLHRDDGPAVEYASGERMWFQHGTLHRDGGPAVVSANGHWAWYSHGKLHREDGPAVCTKGSVQWWVDGVLLATVVTRKELRRNWASAAL